ncbi:DUF885 domain-containing protein [Leifsonia aquatica]|uniref:DUF885 domain-containing protein n=2 Tax=Leifsonia aquatica TaxID=144185 RepID=U2T623_LEIAQ|nr:DUF885 domain-containing protein [Leifsonia aquatica]ERK72913.1 hypothetical protein N136_00728 [Leifsonia aquatica ATCC 14665]MBB2966585.1 uncharacterized protein (DUF885 family) [Leifsonia aquatica]
MTNAEKREPTPIDTIAEAWVDTQLELNPEFHVWLGRPGREGEYADYSPAGSERTIGEVKKALAAIEAAEPVDEIDRITKLDLTRELQLTVEKHDAGFAQRDLNVIASPAQGLREIFDLVPTDTEDDWGNVAKRLHNLPAAMDGYIETLRSGIADGNVPAIRQVREVLAQANKQVADTGFFFELASGAKTAEGTLPETLASDLTAGAKESAAAYAKLADFLQNELAPHAPEKDAVGRELYALASRDFLGATVDLDETYEWGIEELNRMVAEQEAIAKEIKPGASVLEAIAFLDGDPSRKLHGTDALKKWMQETSDRAIEELGKSHFDIPTEIRRLECMIAPTQEGGIYYTGPSDDFARAGRMWWSVPEGVTEFDTWRELTTVYHEGVPGHHLQIAQATYNKAQLNSWRRIAGTSGHAEGWALYAERLMEQLGYLDDPADRLGMLDGQRMRAARVVLDIGVHLEKQLPDGSGPWTGEYAFEFLGRNVNMNDGFVRFEVNRYLGWPGQAPSYKIGQRIWEQLRDEYARREGASFDIKAFHKKALDIGGVGLDTLKSALLD